MKFRIKEYKRINGEIYYIVQVMYKYWPFWIKSDYRSILGSAYYGEYEIFDSLVKAEEAIEKYKKARITDSYSKVTKIIE